MSIGVQMPSFSWMMNQGQGTSGAGGSGSMFDIAGQNLGLSAGGSTQGEGWQYGYRQPPTVENNIGNETVANKTLESSEEELGPDPTPGERIGAGFKQAGQQIANMYSGSSGPIFS